MGAGLHSRLDAEREAETLALERAEAETRATATLQARIAAEEALQAKTLETAAAAKLEGEARERRVSHEQQLKRIRAGDGWHAWRWIAALVAAGAFVTFLWYDKPAQRQAAVQQEVAGEPLRLKLDRQLGN